MKNILIVAALAASLAACQKPEQEATVVEAVPANEAAAAEGTEPAVEMPVQETAAQN